MATKFSRAPNVNMNTSIVQVAGSESRFTSPLMLSGLFSVLGLGARTKQNNTRARIEMAAAAAYSTLKPRPMSSRPSAGAMAEASAVAMPK